MMSALTQKPSLHLHSVGWGTPLGSVLGVFGGARCLGARRSRFWELYGGRTEGDGAWPSSHESVCFSRPVRRTTITNRAKSCYSAWPLWLWTSKCSGITRASLMGGGGYMGTHVGFCYRYHGNAHNIIVLRAYILPFGEHFLGRWWWSITERAKQKAFNRPPVGGQPGLLGSAGSVRTPPSPRHNSHPNHSGTFVVKQDKSAPKRPCEHFLLGRFSQLTLNVGSCLVNLFGFPLSGGGGANIQ